LFTDLQAELVDQGLANQYLVGLQGAEKRPCDSVNVPKSG
jgi:hypothetical protein